MVSRFAYPALTEGERDEIQADSSVRAEAAASPSWKRSSYFLGRQFWPYGHGQRARFIRGPIPCRPAVAPYEPQGWPEPARSSQGGEGGPRCRCPRGGPARGQAQGRGGRDYHVGGRG